SQLSRDRKTGYLEPSTRSPRLLRLCCRHGVPSEAPRQSCARTCCAAIRLSNTPASAALTCVSATRDCSLTRHGDWLLPLLRRDHAQSLAQGVAQLIIGAFDAPGAHRELLSSTAFSCPAPTAPVAVAKSTVPASIQQY